MGGGLVGGLVVGGAVVGGGGVVGGGAPPHSAPLSWQLVGEPGPLPMKPKETEAPGAMVPFQDRLLKVYRWPAECSSASQ